MKLVNKTRSSSKVGYLVKSVPGGFAYAGVGDTPIGVVTERVPVGAECDIQTSGEAKVFVGRVTSSGVSLRAPSLSGDLSGHAYNIGTSKNHILIGTAISHGVGLIKVALSIGSASSTSTSGGTASSHFDLTDIGVTIHDDIDTHIGVAAAHIADVTTNPHNVTATQILPGQGGQAGEFLYTNGTVASWEPVSFNVTVDGFAATPNTISAGGTFDFVGDTTYIQIQWNQTTQQLEFSYIGPTTFYSGWDIWVDDVDTTRVVTSGMAVNFKSGTYTSISHNFLTGPPPHNDITIDVDTTTLDGRYYTQTWVDANIYTITESNANFDNYNGWEYEYDPVTPQSKTIASGNSFGIVAGTDIGTSWDGVNNRITINYTGSPGTMNSWNWEVLGVPHSIANGGTAEIIAGTNITIGYTLGGGGEHQATINADLSSYYTSAQVDAGFYSQAWIDANIYTITESNAAFDNYGSWDFEFDPVTPQVKAINSGDSFGIVGGTDIGTSWDGVNNRLTINYAGGGSSYTGWNFEVLGVAHNIGNGGTAELIAGTGIGITYTLGGAGEHQATISSTGGVSVSNQGDNRVVTSTATTNSLYAESNFTYNGTYMKVGNGATAIQIVPATGAAGFPLYTDVSGESPFISHAGATGTRSVTLGVVDDSTVPIYLYMYEGNNPSTSFMTFGTGGNERMRIHPAGRIGMGTVATPSGQLHVEGGSTTMLALGRASGNASIKATTAAGYLMVDSAGQYLSLNHYVSDNIVMVNGGGDVGIGTVGTEAKLHVQGGAGNTGQIKIEGGNTAVLAIGEINAELLFGSNDSSVQSTGNIGGKISSITEASNGANVGMAFYTYDQTYTTAGLTKKMQISNEGDIWFGTGQETNDEGVYLHHEYIAGNSSGRLFFNEGVSEGYYGMSLLYAADATPVLGPTTFSLTANTGYLIMHNNSLAGNVSMSFNRTTAAPALYYAGASKFTTTTYGTSTTGVSEFDVKRPIQVTTSNNTYWYKLGTLAGQGSRVRIVVNGNTGYSSQFSNKTEGMVFIGNADNEYGAWQYTIGDASGDATTIEYKDVGVSTSIDVYVKLGTYFVGSIEIIDGQGFTFNSTASTPLTDPTGTDAAKALRVRNNLYVTGGVYATGESESYDTSDMRFKDVIQDLDKAETAEYILGLRTFRYTQKGEERVRLGVSAQEVQEVFPENVKEDEDGKLLVHYGKMVPALIATIQRQQEQIDELMDRIK